MPPARSSYNFAIPAPYAVIYTPSMVMIDTKGVRKWKIAPSTTQNCAEIQYPSDVAWNKECGYVHLNSKGNCQKNCCSTATAINDRQNSLCYTFCIASFNFFFQTDMLSFPLGRTRSENRFWFGVYFAENSRHGCPKLSKRSYFFLSMSIALPI